MENFRKSVLFFLPTLNSYLDRVNSISLVTKFKINFVFIKNDNEKLANKLLKKGHNIFFKSEIIQKTFLFKKMNYYMKRFTNLNFFIIILK